MALDVYAALKAPQAGASPGFTPRPPPDSGMSVRADTNAPLAGVSQKPDGVSAVTTPATPVGATAPPVLPTATSAPPHTTEPVAPATEPAAAHAAEGKPEADTPAAAQDEQPSPEAHPPMPTAQKGAAATPKASAITPKAGRRAQARAAGARTTPKHKGRKRYKAKRKSLQRHTVRKNHPAREGKPAAHPQKKSGGRPNYNGMNVANAKKANLHEQGHDQGMDPKMFANVLKDPAKLAQMPDFMREQLFNQMSPTQREQLGQHLPQDLKEKFGPQLNVLNQQTAQNGGAGGFKVGGFSLNTMAGQPPKQGGMGRPLASGPRAEGYSLGTFGA